MPKISGYPKPSAGKKKPVKKKPMKKPSKSRSGY